MALNVKEAYEIAKVAQEETKLGFVEEWFDDYAFVIVPEDANETYTTCVCNVVNKETGKQRFVHIKDSEYAIRNIPIEEVL